MVGQVGRDQAGGEGPLAAWGVLRGCTARGEDRRVSRIVPDMFAEATRSPEVAAVLREQVGGARRNKVAAILHRAVERGELPAGTDIELGLDFLAGPLYWRVSIIQAAPDPERMQRLTDKIIAALAI
ncbi:TetR-like C-terminal domain-containing protein [Bailinhaonella thermotolerans]|uniref:TetR-like C-terminal domain-containing protein n=1 Tax=Bailinhaonella thermotolerans TaxID=1070861 RepID=UPI00192A3845|nr:TetR-like C-terminal domain-containing protein [Bailinhaonella thermotolerans]